MVQILGLSNEKLGLQYLSLLSKNQLDSYKELGINLDLCPILSKCILHQNQHFYQTIDY